MRFVTALVSAAAVSAAFGGEFDSYSFGLLGDIHYDGPHLHASDGFYKNTSRQYYDDWMKIEKANLRLGAGIFEADPKVAFVLQSGDFVSGGTGSLELQKQMLTEAWDEIRPIFANCGPFYVINGNHETYDFDKPGQYAYPGFAATIQKFNAKELGRESCEKHFWFRKGPDLYVGYDSNVDEYEFVKAAFERNPDARWTFVIGHIPTIVPVPGGIELESPVSGNFMDNHERFLTLLQRRNAILLCGDTHTIGFLDYVTGEGRFSQLMGVAVMHNGPFAVTADSPFDYPTDMKPFFTAITPHQEYFKPGLVRYWQAHGAGCWKLEVDDTRVTAVLRTWDRPDEIAKRFVIRGPEVETASVRLELPEQPFRPGANRCRVVGAANVKGTWKFALPKGWAVRNFKPAEGTLDVVVPDTPHPVRTREAIRLAAFAADGRIVANEARHFWHQDEIRAVRTAEGLKLRLEAPGGAVRPNPDVAVDGPDKWPSGSALELFVDPLNRKDVAVSSATVQLVIFPTEKGVRSVAIRYPHAAGEGPIWARYGIGVADALAPKWTADPAKVEAMFEACDDGKVRMTVLVPWKAIAPASNPDFVPAAGSLIGLDAAWCDRPVLGGAVKLWDDPSTWANVRL